MKNSITQNKVSLLSYLQEPVIALAFLLPLIYWIYLAFTTQMNIRFDAQGFEKLAGYIYHQGWPAFFEQNPDQSPLYPFLISISMRIADFFALPYQRIQTIFQIFLLLLSQFLLLKILTRINIKKSLIAFVLLYFGFSPAIVNSAFSLFCEILTYPFVLGIILCSVEIWNLILSKERFGRIVSYSILLAAIFFLITCTRAIYEYILVVYIFFFALISIKFIRETERFLRAIAFLSIVFICFQTLLTPYKLMNLKYNGHKVTIIVGASSVYADAVGRTRPITGQQLLIALSFIPGDGVCWKFFGKEKCDFWYNDMYQIGLKKVEALRKAGIPNEQHDKILYREAKEHIFQKPFQYALLNAIEGFKMFFWESTRIGFVAYPVWLEKIFRNVLFKDVLRLAVAIVTIFCFLDNLIYVFRRRDFYEVRSNTIYLFTILVVVTANIVLHSFFITVTRYALPFAPLYLILIACTLQRKTASSNHPSHY